MFEEIKKLIISDLDAVPAAWKNHQVTKELIRCVLYGYSKQLGLIPIPEYRVPRYPEGPVDLVVLDEKNIIKYVFVSAPTVELNHVKSMDRIDAERKIIITFSENEKKVTESMFFLNKGIEHLNLHKNTD